MQCVYVKKNKEQCKAKALGSDRYCFFHSKKNKAKRLEASKKGGSVGMPKVLEATDFTINDSSDIFRLLSEVMVGVLTGRLSPKIGNSASYIGSQVLKSFELMSIEKRVSALEKAIERKGVKIHEITH